MPGAPPSQSCKRYVPSKNAWEHCTTAARPRTRRRAVFRFRNIRRNEKAPPRESRRTREGGASQSHRVHRARGSAEVRGATPLLEPKNRVVHDGTRHCGRSMQFRRQSASSQMGLCSGMRSDRAQLDFLVRGGTIFRAGTRSRRGALGGTGRTRRRAGQTVRSGRGSRPLDGLGLARRSATRRQEVGLAWRTRRHGGGARNEKRMREKIGRPRQNAHVRGRMRSLGGSGSFPLPAKYL